MLQSEKASGGTTGLKICQAWEACRYVVENVRFLEEVRPKLVAVRKCKHGCGEPKSMPDNYVSADSLRMNVVKNFEIDRHECGSSPEMDPGYRFVR